MSGRVPPIDEDDVVEVPPWRQRKVLVIAALTVGVVAVVMARGRPEPKEEEPAKPAQSYIGMVVPYVPAPASAIPPPPIQRPERTAEVPAPPAPQVQ